MHSFSATDVLAGLDTSHLNSLAPDQRKLLLVIMARVAERSYRRGAQQGHTYAKRGEFLPQSMGDWRYGSSTDVSPWLVPARVETSVERLLTENRGLRPLFGDGTALPQIEGDIDVAARQLIRLVERHHDAGAQGRPMDVIDTRQQIRSLAIELCFVCDGMAQTYDRAVEIAGYQGVQGVSAIWTGIGGWSA